MLGLIFYIIDIFLSIFIIIIIIINIIIIILKKTSQFYGHQHRSLTKSLTKKWLQSDQGWSSDGGIHNI